MFIEMKLKLLATNDFPIVEIESKYFHPTEVDFLLSDPTKTKEKLGWKAKYSVEELAKDMVEGDRKEMEGLEKTF